MAEEKSSPPNDFQRKLAEHLGYGITAEDLNQPGVHIRGCTDNQNKWDTLIDKMKDNKLKKVNAKEYVYSKKREFFNKHCKPKAKATWKVVSFDKSCENRDMHKRDLADAAALRNAIDKLPTDKGIKVAFDKVEGLTYFGKSHAQVTQDKRVGRELKFAGGGSNHGRMFIGYNTDKKEVYMECIPKHLKRPYLPEVTRLRDKAMAQSIDYGDYGDYDIYGDYNIGGDYTTDAQNGYIGHYEYHHPQKYLYENNSIQYDYLLLVPALIISLCCCVIIWFICCGIGGSTVYIMTRKSERNGPRVAHYDEESLK